MNDFEDKILILKGRLSKTEQQFLCLKSISNFLIYFEKLRSNRSKVENLLVEYFQTVDDVIYTENFPIDFETCKFLFNRHIFKLGFYYRKELGFKNLPTISGALFWGLQVDLLLFFVGVLHKVYYIPIITLTLLFWCIYIKIFYETKHKVYAVKY